MSDLTQCNYCVLSELKLRAKKCNKEVVIKKGNNGGIDIHLVAPWKRPCHSNFVA